MTTSESAVDESVAGRVGDVAGFWRRTAAFGIDCVVLGLIGLALAILFFDQLAAIGQWGRLIGFLIGSTYFGLMEGHAGRCQSLGKQALKIKVIKCDADGIATLGVTQACLRYAIVAVPTVLGGIAFVDLPALNSPHEAWISRVNSFAVFLWGAALVYLLAFNRPSRQSLQDLAVSSLVVRVSTKQVRVVQVRRKHWVALGAFAGLILLASPFVNRYLASKLTELDQIQRATLTVPSVMRSGVTMSSIRHVGSSGDAPRTVTIISVVSGSPMLQTEQGTHAIARAAFGAWPMLANQDIVTIVSVRGADLGIASWRTQFVESWPGRQWASKMTSP
ncbi:RDD family protein [Burkholderia ubonensis]|uniref:RDD family protein n=1 Tax=Burkholderia ubonensis TaxID=101571 RepID=UPI00076D1EF1|nr:RDD family protein [Burkholderia ubonensis]KVP66810.1 hypothetical protein WJ93_23005 [Burkholderia ubonensis]KVR39766.1 hypothetical protein WK16_01800 [Burkholderia ubonensis]